MKKLLILLVAFCAACINTYASNYSAGKNPDAEYASCNIQTMLNDPKSTQWFRPQCVRILATRLERGSLNQNEKEQLKKVLVPAFYNIVEQYAYLTGNRAKEEAPHFMDLYKSLTQLADEKGTYGLLRSSNSFMFLEKGKQVEGGSKQAEIVGQKPQVFNFGKLPDDVLHNRVQLTLAKKASEDFLGKKKTPGELTSGLSGGVGGSIPAIDVSHLESVFLFEKDSKLEEKDFVFDIAILNDMLKERRDFRPLLTFLAENASFNKKHINYIPPRFVRLVLTYYAESLFPAEQAKLMDYVTNPNYSKPFRFLAATVAAAYAYNKDYKDFYEGKFRYYPQEAVAIIEALRTGKTGNPAEALRLEFLGKRVLPYVKGQLLIPVEKNKESNAPAVALTMVLAKTMKSKEFVSLAQASAPESLLVCGGFLVLYGYADSLSDAFSLLYRTQFYALLARLPYVEVPEKYVPENLKANADKYPIVNGKIRVPTMERTQHPRPGSLGTGTLNAPAAGSATDQVALSVSWNAKTHALVGESAEVVAASEKEPASCVYVRQKNAEQLTLAKLPKYVVLADTATKERMEFLYDCMVAANYCVNSFTKEVGLSERFEACGKVDVLEIVPPEGCKYDIEELRIFWRNAKSFYAPFNAYQINNQINNPTKQIKHDKDLFARALYNNALGGWIPEVEIRIFADGNDLAAMIVQNLKDVVFGKDGLPIFSDSPITVLNTFVYRFGKHEKESAYRLVRTVVKGKDNVITNEKLMFKGCKEITPECIYRHLHFEELKSYMDENDKKTRPYICNHTIFANKEQFFGPLPAGQ